MNVCKRRLLGWRFFLCLGATGWLAACSVASDSAQKDALRSSLSAPGRAAVADGNDAIAVTVLLRDVAGGPLPGRVAELRVDDANVTIEQPARTDAEGRSVAWVRSTTVGSVRIAASFFDAGGRVQLPETLVLHFVAPPGTSGSVPSNVQLALQLAPDAATADGNAALVVTVRAQGAGAHETAGTPVVLSGLAPRDVLAPAQGTLDASGTWTASLTSTLAGVRTLRAQAAQLAATASCRFVAGPPNAARSQLLVDVRQAGADGEDALGVEVILRDAFDNPVSGQFVTLQAGSSNTTFVPPGGTTDANGSVRVRMHSTELGAQAVTAAINGDDKTTTGAATLSLQGRAQFVAGPASAATSTLQAVGPPAVADGTSLAPLVLALRDTAGHPIAEAAVALASGDGRGRVVANANVTGADGQLAFAVTSTAVGATAVRVQRDAMTLSADVNFVPGVPDGQACTLTPARQSLVADGNDVATLRLHAQDAFGHPLAGQAVALASTSPNVNVVPATGTTDAAGNLVATARGTTSGTTVVLASLTTASLAAQLDLVAGPASAGVSSLTVTPARLLADDVARAAVAVRLRDAHGNPAAGAPARLVLGDAGTVGASLEAPTGTADAAGTYVTAARGRLAQATFVQLALTDGNLRAPLALVPGAPDALQSSLSASPNGPLTADGNAAFALAVAVRDAQGNPVGGQRVTLAADGAACRLAPVAGLANAAGALLSSLTSAQAGTVAVTATLGAASEVATVRFVPGPPVAAASALVLAGGNVLADGSTAAMVAVRARDATGNPVANVLVTPRATVPGVDTFEPPTSTTDADGSATFAWRSTATGRRALAVELTAADATAPAARLIAQQTFVAGPVDAGQSSVGVSPNVVVAGGPAASFVVKLRDAAGNPISGRAVTVTPLGGGVTLAAASGTTAADGDWVGSLAATQAGAKQLQVNVPGTSLLSAFTVAPAAAATGASSLVANAAAVVADGNAYATLTLQLRDAYGNAVANAPATMQASPAAGTHVVPAMGATGPDGSLAAQVSGTVAGVRTVRAQAGNVALTLPLQLVAGPMDAAASSWAADPDAPVADGVSSAVLRLWARDAHGNPVGDAPIVLRSDVPGDVVAAAGALRTAADGSLVATLSGRRAGLRHAFADCGNLTFAADVQLSPAAVDAAHSLWTAAPAGGVPADGNATVTLTLRARDAADNPLAGEPATVRASSATAKLAGTGGPQATVLLDAAGAWQGTLVDTVANVVQLTAEVQSTALRTSVPFVAGAPDPARSALWLGSDVLYDDDVNGVDVLVLAVDAQGNPVPDAAVTLAASGANNTFSPPSGTTAADGSFRATLRSELVQTQQVVATLGAVSLQANLRVLAGAPEAAHTILTAQPNVLLAQPGTTSTVTLRVADGTGAPVPNLAVALTATGGSATLAPTTGVTDVDGSLNALLQASAAGNVWVQAQVGGINVALRVPVVAGPPDAASSTLLATPPTVVADGNAAAVVTARLRDSYGNPAAGVAVHFGADDGNAFVLPTDVVTDAAGVAQTSVAAVAAQAVGVAAQAGNLALSTHVTFQPGPPSAAASELTVVAATAVADNNDAAPLRVAVRDLHGNPVSGAAVQLTADAADARFGAAPSADAVAVATTDAAGDAVALLRRTVAGPTTVTARVAGVAVTAVANFVAGPVDANHSNLTSATPSSVADGNDAAWITLTLRDAHGNPAGGRNVALQLNAGTGTVLPNAGVSDANGTFVAQVRATHVDVKQLVATAAAAGIAGSDVSIALPLTFVAGAPVASLSTLAAAPATVVADGRGASVVQLVVRDAWGNRVVGVPVRLTGSAPDVDLSPALVRTDADGAVVAAATATVAASRSLQVEFAGQILDVTVRFVAGPPDANASTLVTAPSSAVADGVSALTATVALRDARGNAVAGTAVQFDSDVQADQLTDTDGNALMATPVVTDAGGEATVRLASTVAGGHVLRASFPGGQLQHAVRFVAGRPSSARSSLQWTSDAAVADGSDGVTLALVVRDAYDNAVAGQPVMLAVTGSDNALDAANGTTDASGAFATVLRTTRAEIKSITAKLGDVSLGGAARFVAGPPAPAHSTLSVVPPVVVADGASTGTAVVRWRDAFDNACAGLAVHFFADHAAWTAVPADAVTDATGVASAGYVSRVATDGTLSVGVAGGVPLTAALRFVAGPPAATTTTLVVVPTPLVADGASTAAVTLGVRDAAGNPVGGAPVHLHASGGELVFGAVDGNTAADGTFSTTLQGSAAGTYVVAADLGATAVHQAVTLVAGPPSARTSRIVLRPTQAVADGNAAIALEVQVADAQGNPVPNGSVALTVGGTNNVLDAAGGATDAAGRFQTVLRSTRAQHKPLTAAIGGVSIAATADFVAASPSAQTLQLVADVADGLVADGNCFATLSLLAQDRQQNPIVGQSVTFAATGANVDLTPSSATTDADGVATTQLRSTRAERKRASATVAGVGTFADVRFVAGPPSPTTSRLTTVGSPARVGRDGAVDLTLSLADAQGNPVPGAAVHFATDGNAVALAPADATTSAAGQAATRLTTALAQSASATANVGDQIFAAPVRFVAGEVDNASSAFVISPNQVVANGASVATVWVRLADALGNPVPNQPVAFLSSVAGDAFADPAPVTDAAGAVSTTLRSTFAGRRVLTARAQNTSLSQPITFVAGPASDATSSVIANPNQVVADGDSGTTLTLLLRDAFNNPLADVAVTWSSDDANATFGSPAVRTDAAGNAMTSMQDTRAGLRAAVASVDGTAIAAQVKFVPGPPSAAQSSWSATPDYLVADGNQTTTLSVVVRDAQRNVVPNQNVVVFVSGRNNSLEAASGATDANGAFATTLASTRAEPKLATCSAGSASVGTTVTFVAGSATSSTVSLSATPASAVANANDAITLALLASDALGNPIVGAPVALSGSGVAAMLGNANLVTDGNGEATTTVTSRQAGGYLASATLQAVTVQAGATFVPGPASATSSTLSLSPNVAVADGNSAVALAVTVRDALANPIAGQTVTVAAGGTANVLDANVLVTDATGVASTALRSTVAQRKPLQVRFAGQQLDATASFVAGATSNAASSFVAGSTPTVADGNAAAVLSFVGRDAAGNPVPGRAVSLALTGSDGVFDPASPVTDANGAAQARLRSTVAETKNVVLSVDGTSFTLAAPFVAGPPDVSASSLAAVPAQGVAGGTVTLGATVRDAFGNPVGGARVDWASDAAGDAVVPASGITSPAGTATATLGTAVAGPRRASAQIGPARLGVDVRFVAAAPSAATSTLTAAPSRAAAATPVAVVAHVYDAYGNPVVGQGIVFSAGGTDTTLSPNVAVLDANGTASSVLVCTRTQTQQVVASVGGVSLASLRATVTTVPGPANAASSTLAIEPNVVPATGFFPARLTATVRDAYGNPVPDRQVSFSSPGTSVRLPVGPTTTDAGGRAASTAASSVVQPTVVTATFDAASVGGALQFVAATPPSPANSSFVVTPNALLHADGRPNAVATFSARDANGNALAYCPVTLRSPTNNLKFATTYGATDANGTFTTTVASQIWGVAPLWATSGNVALKQTLSYAPRANACSMPSSFGDSFPRVRLTSGNNYTPIAFADVTGDAKPEAFFAGQGTVGVVINQGDGTAAAVKYLGGGSAPYSLQLVDLDNDGKLDLLRTSHDTNALHYFLGTGGGNFAAATALSLQNAPYGAWAEDFDRDGLVDLAVTDTAAQTVNFYRATAARTWSFRQAVPLAFAPSRLFGAHVNGNNYNDLLVGNNAANDGRFAVLLALGDGNFAPPRYVNDSVAGPDGFAVADLNADGNLDVLVGSAADVRIAVHLGAGGGNFMPAVTYATGAAAALWPVVGDVDRDGRPDVLAGLGANVVVWHNDGTGVLGSPRPLPFSGDEPNEMLVGRSVGLVDFTGDGNLDVVATSLSSSSFFVLPGSGNGTFSVPRPPAYALPFAPFRLVAADLDGDGVLDLVANCADGNVPAVAVLPGAGDGTFAAARTFGFDPNFSTAGLAVADLNHDGVADLLVTGNGLDANRPTSVVQIALGLGNGKFAAPLLVPVNYEASALVVADLNNDGFPDVAVSSYNAGTVTLLYGDGTGSLTARTTLSAGSISNVAAGDIDNDGRVDIFATRYIIDSANAYAYLNGGNDAWTLISNNLTIRLHWAAVRDFTGDGLADVFVSNSGRQPYFALGNGSGTFVTTALAGAYDSQFAATVGDVDGDGQLDVVNGATVTLNAGAPAFRYPETFYECSNVQGTAVGDLNGDKMLDVAVAATSANQVLVLLNRGCAPTAAAGTPNALLSSMSLSPTGTAVGVGDGNVVTATVRAVGDDNAPLMRAGIVLTTTAPGVSWVKQQGLTDANGIFVGKFRATTAQMASISATLGEAVVLAGNVTFAPAAVAAARSTLVASPNVVVAGGNLILTATARDAYGNACPNQTVSFASTGSTNTFSPTSATSDANGRAATSLSSTTAQTKTLRATSGGVTWSTTASFVAGSPNAMTLSVSNANGTVNGNANVAVSLSVVDRYNNGTPNQMVRLSSLPNPFDGFSAPSGLTSSSGTFSSTMSARLAGKKTVVARAAGLTRSVEVNFAATAPFCAGPNVPRLGGVPALAGPPTLTGLETYDADGDGRQDVFATGTLPGGNNTFFYYHSRGAGRFDAPATVELPCAASAMAQGNLNGNRMFAIGCSDANFVALVRPQNGGGNFLVGQTPNFVVRSTGVAMGDVTGDGRADLVVFDANTGWVGIFVQASDGSGFAAGANFTVSGRPSAVAVGEMTGDAYGDLVVADADGNQVLLYAGRADGSVSAPSVLLTGSRPTAVALGQLNGDAHLDLAVHFAGNDNDVVAAGDGNGGVAVVFAFANGSGGTLRLADVDRDGVLDVVSTKQSAGAELADLFTARSGGNNSFVETRLPRPYVVPNNGLLALGELSGDAFVDLVLAANAGPTFVTLGNGNNAFASPPTYPGYLQNTMVRAVDLNKDGLLDLVSPAQDANATAGYAGSLASFFGSADGNFAAPTYAAPLVNPNTALGRPARYLSFVDLDGDDYPDAVTLADDANAPGIGSYVNDRAGNLVPRAFLPAPVSGGLGGGKGPAVGDFDGDGLADVVASGTNPNQLVLARGLGNGTFAAPTSFAYGINAVSTQLAAADVNRDGLLDLVVQGTGNGLAVLLNAGAGPFVLKGIVGTARYGDAAVADFTGDGNVDLLARASSNSVTFFRGLGDGTFAAGATTTLAGMLVANHAYTAVGDFNGDGWPDVVLSDQAAQTITVLSTDGAGNVSLLGVFPGAAGLNRGLAIGDFDRNGRLDVAINAGNSRLGVLLNVGCY